MSIGGRGEPIRGRQESPSRVEALVAALSEVPAGRTGPELLAELRRRWSALSATQLRRLIETAGDAVRVDGDRFYAIGPQPGSGMQRPTPGPADAPLRAVAFDLEAIPRLTSAAPYVERAVWQVGAVRFGRDQAWVEGNPRMVAWVEMPDGYVIGHPGAAAQHQAHGRPPAAVYRELAAFCDGADALVAYNGTGLDFGALDDACDSAGVHRIDGPGRIDALYLAYVWWPTATGHRLHDLAAAVGVDLGGLHWHDAADDAEALARLVAHGAATVTGGWAADFAELVACVGAASLAWRLAFDLAVPSRGGSPATVPLDDVEVAASIENSLVTPPVRPVAPSSYVLAVPAGWRGRHGHVDPYLLSAAVNPGAQRRPAQDQMAVEIRARFPPGPDLAIEAPTGTGKSLAALAAAFDWLATGPERRVVIATHTKQLQAQLATDVESLAAAAPGLLQATGIVKGATNRLSIRALVTVCADLASARSGPAARGVLGDVRFAELVVYILNRLTTAPVSMLSAHEARSVDTADVPAFFDDYSGGRWGAYLAVLSQAAAGDYTDAAGLGAHTRLVSEHLGALRLVVANHALVFAHLGDLGAHGADTLLIVDEAHAAESSATEAFSSTFSYQHAERVSQLLSAWAARPDATPALVDRARNLEGVLQTERPARTAMVAVDRLSGVAAGEHARTGTLASPFIGDIAAGATRTFLGELGKIARACTGAKRALAGWYGATAATLSRRERDRHAELAARLAEVAAGASEVVSDVDALLGTSYLSPQPSPGRVSSGGGPGEASETGGAPGPGNGTGGDGVGNGPGVGATAFGATGDGGHAPINDLGADHNDGDDTDGATGSLTEQDVAEDAAGASDADDRDGTGDGGNDDAEVDTDRAPPGMPVGNRVVWIAEQPGSDLAGGTRRYRFEVRSGPVRLPADGEWVRFRSLFARTVFTSATLTVAGGWDYLFDRLGIQDCDTVSLPGPFDYASQGRLVCFADFPSWAEHKEAAMRTVAHQLTGYAREARAAGRTPGAIVLTTATATAAGIAEHLAAYTARAGLDVPLAAAPILGNRRAVEWFRTAGGWLVGTKGLWAGVDVAEPDRVRIVWINKIPFAPFADPLVAARRAEAAARAAVEGHPDPDAAATERYYLPLSAVELRQAVGRLIRSDVHRGVIVISDRKLAGAASTRRLYRRILLGSLDPGLLVTDPVTGEAGGGNIVTMTEGWDRIWEFLAAGGDIDPARLAELTTPEALDGQALLAETRAIRDLELTAAEIAVLQASGGLADEVVDRSGRVGGLLRFAEGPLTLKAEQVAAIRAVAEGRDLLALLPTGFGKSYCFQLPALVLPGVTIVVSPLVALMADQALELNRAIGGAVRALVSPLRESSSRAGRQEVAEQLTGAADHHIKLVYVSPERFAHRQFRQWVHAGITAGRVQRIVFDEAHTLVQWGDDFRPAYRRLTTALSDLRPAGEERLAVSALTATANKAVREGLRTILFGLPATVDPATGDPDWFRWVQANPVRPELGVYKAQLAAGGPVSVARYVESVFDALDGHAVFYCLTVREVDAMWAHLVDYVGPAGAARVRRFHGRLPEAEKASLLADFRDAPYTGDDGFAPMVVVATSAFGLGINRGDIRCVFVTSPPTDLAALYQQLGRAGRDATGTIPADGEQANIGVALATGRGFRTVEFLTRDLPVTVLEAAACEVLGCHHVLDARAAGDRLIAVELAAGRLSIDAANRDAVRDRYRTAVVRALAALADAAAVDDLGDLPATLRLTPGETPAPTGADPDSRFAQEAQAWVAADAARAKRTSVLELHAHLAAAGVAIVDDPAATWAALVELHHAGVLDVSAAPNRSWLTGVRVRTRTLPASFTETVSARRRRAAKELVALRAWYGDTATCANQGIADYLAAAPPGRLPAGTCSTAACRCSSCWGRDGTGTLPRLLDAVLHPAARPASAADDRMRRARLDQAIDRLLYDNPGGLGPAMIRRCLRGEDTYFNVAARQRRSLRPALLYHRLFGSRPGLREDAVHESLGRLEAAGLIVGDGFRWRSATRVAATAAAAARATATAAGAGPALS